MSDAVQAAAVAVSHPPVLRSLADSAEDLHNPGRLRAFLEQFVVETTMTLNTTVVGVGVAFDDDTKGLADELVQELRDSKLDLMIVENTESALLRAGRCELPSDAASWKPDVRLRTQAAVGSAVAAGDAATAPRGSTPLVTSTGLDETSPGGAAGVPNSVTRTSLFTGDDAPLDPWERDEAERAARLQDDVDDTHDASDGAESGRRDPWADDEARARAESDADNGSFSDLVDADEGRPSTRTTFLSLVESPNAGTTGSLLDLFSRPSPFDDPQPGADTGERTRDADGTGDPGGRDDADERDDRPAAASTSGASDNPVVPTIERGILGAMNRPPLAVVPDPVDTSADDAEDDDADSPSGDTPGLRELAFNPPVARDAEWSGFDDSVEEPDANPADAPMPTADGDEVASDDAVDTADADETAHDNVGDTEEPAHDNVGDTEETDDDTADMDDTADTGAAVAELDDDDPIEDAPPTTRLPRIVPVDDGADASAEEGADAGDHPAGSAAPAGRPRLTVAPDPDPTPDTDSAVVETAVAESLRAELAERNVELAELRDELERVQAEHDQTRALLVTRDAELVSARIRFDEVKAAHEATLAAVPEQTEVVTSLRRSLVAAEQTAAQRAQELSERDATVADLTARIAAQDVELDERRRAASAGDAESVALRSEVGELRRQLAERNQQLADVRSQLASAHAQLAADAARLAERLTPAAAPGTLPEQAMAAVLQREADADRAVSAAAAPAATQEPVRIPPIRHPLVASRPSLGRRRIHARVR